MEEVCATQKGRVWVAEVGASVVGFVAVELQCSGVPDRRYAEIPGTSLLTWVNKSKQEASALNSTGPSESTVANVTSMYFAYLRTVNLQVLDDVPPHGSVAIIFAECLFPGLRCLAL